MTNDFVFTLFIVISSFLEIDILFKARFEAQKQQRLPSEMEGSFFV